MNDGEQAQRPSLVSVLVLAALLSTVVTATIWLGWTGDATPQNVVGYLLGLLASLALTAQTIARLVQRVQLGPPSGGRHRRPFFSMAVA